MYEFEQIYIIKFKPKKNCSISDWFSLFHSSGVLIAPFQMGHSNFISDGFPRQCSQDNSYIHRCIPDAPWPRAWPGYLGLCQWSGPAAQEESRERGARAESERSAISWCGAGASDQAGADFTRFQTLDTGHTQSSVVSAQWCNIVIPWGDAVTCDNHHNTVTPSLVTLGELYFTRQWLVKSCQDGDSKIQTDGKL